MAKLNNYKSHSASISDFAIGCDEKGRSKKISIGSIAKIVDDTINNLDNFKISNSDNGYTLDWKNNTLSVDGPSIENAIISVSSVGAIKSETTNRKTNISLVYSGVNNIIELSKPYKGELGNVEFFVQDKINNVTGKFDISKLPYTTNTGTVESITFLDDFGAKNTITKNGGITIKGGRGVVTKIEDSDLTIEYTGKIGGTLNKIVSLDETVIMTSSASEDTVNIKPVKIPLLKAGRYDFASVTVDTYGRVTKIEDKTNIINGLISRIEALESQIQTQNESITDTSN
jgi:hypothetical protein